MRGGSITTTVSAGVNSRGTEANIAEASADMNVVLGMELSVALCLAEMIDAGAMSIPKETEKREERVMVKRAEPQYASMRYLGLGEEGEKEELGGMMWVWI